LSLCLLRLTLSLLQPGKKHVAASQKIEITPLLAESDALLVILGGGFQVFHS